jgi:hypothetical protein
MQGFSLTSWDFAPGTAYADVLEVRPPELVVDPMAMDLESGPGGGCEPDPGIAAARRRARTAQVRANNVGRPAFEPPPTSDIKLPVAFEPNMGQADSSVAFLARASGHLLLARPTDIILALPEPTPREPDRDRETRAGIGQPRRPHPSKHRRHALVKMKLRGARPFEFEGQDTLPGYSHYFIGDEASRWATHVPNYASVTARNVYPGIDLVLRDSQGRAEYDLVVAPGIDPSVVELQFDGVRRIDIDSDGNLVLTTALGSKLRQARPLIYQDIAGERRAVVGGFKLRDKRAVGFQVGIYDRRLPLVIDPVIVWSAILGGTANDWINALAVDASGVYATGSTSSVDFPLQEPFQPVKDVGGDAFVTKYHADGSGLAYSSYLGGDGYNDEGAGITVDSSGSAVVVGRTSGSFPIVNASPIGPQGGNDVFVTKVDSDGSALDYSTRIGGTANDEVADVALDGQVAHLVGWTSSFDFPLQDPYQATKVGALDSFALGLSDGGQPQIAYSTYLGGTDLNGSGQNRAVHATAVTADGIGNTYMVGYTNAEVFTGSFPCVAAGEDDEPFVARLSNGHLAALNCFGGSSFDLATDVALAQGGTVWVVGDTNSSDFPVQNAPFSFTGDEDAFVSAFSADLSSLSFSTPFGGSETALATAVAVDASGKIVVAGVTSEDGIPIIDPMQGCPSSQVGWQSFLLRLDPISSQADYATYLPGPLLASRETTALAAASDGSVYVGGITYADNDFSEADASVTKLDDGSAPQTPGTILLDNGTSNGSPVGVDESWDPFPFQVFRIGGGAGVVSADVATTDGTALAGADYAPLTATAVFAENTCSVAYEVPVLDDSVPESDEAFSLGLSNFTGGASGGAIDSVEVTILDDDCGGGGGTAEGTFTISHRLDPLGPDWEATVDVPWLSLDATSGVGPSTVTVFANPTGLAPGTHLGRITVTASDATGSPQVVEVTFTVSDGSEE